MVDILLPQGLEALAAASRQRLILAFDFDGTLAPIVDDPRAARLGTSTRGLLRVLSLLSPCAVISGRARADVMSRLGSPALAAVIGNHGSEPSDAPAPAALRARLRGWAAAFREATDPEEVQVEDKGYSIAVHYRRSRSSEKTARRIWAVARLLSDARVVEGRAVLNVVPHETPTKGDAVARFAARYPGRPAAFIGDDESDEPAFRAPAVTLPIRVGRHARSGARYFLRAQNCIDTLLREVIRAKVRADGLPEEWLAFISEGGR